jgi:aminoglycoside phosphotransferase
MRVSLPVDPRYKTESEVATTEFVRQKTSLPVPRIIAFDSHENELGFEWILMDMMPGLTLRKRWRKMS